MKKIILTMFLLLCSGRLMAGALRVETSPILSVSTATTVSISTSAWTAVPTATLSSRNGIVISNPSTNSSSVYGVIVSPGNNTPATTVRPFEFEIGENDFIPLGDGTTFYLISGNSTAESVHVQEIAQ